MNSIATFEKVSYDTWYNDSENNMLKMVIKQITRRYYDGIELPVRSTSGSAGYDFHTPIGITIKPGETVVIGTGIKANIEEGWVLLLFPRSSLGFKYRLKMDNTIGVIDSDYYNNPTNEGHIMVSVTNEGDKPVSLEAGSRFCQGIFVPFGITKDDDVTESRIGGTGSTGV